MKYEFLVNFTSKKKVDSILANKEFWIKNPSSKDPFEVENYEFCPKNINTENRKRFEDLYNRSRFWICFVKIDIQAMSYNEAKSKLKTNKHLFAIYNNFIADRSLNSEVDGFIIFDKNFFEVDLAGAVSTQTKEFTICRKHIDYQDMLKESKVIIFVFNDFMIADFSKSNIHNFLKHKKDPTNNEFYFGEDEFRYLISANTVKENFLLEKIVVNLSEKSIIDFGTYNIEKYFKAHMDNFSISNLENYSKDLIDRGDLVLICNPETLQKLKDKKILNFETGEKE